MVDPTHATWRSSIAGTSGISTPACRSARASVAKRKHSCVTFDTDFARRHRTALSGIAERIGLDYFTVDCAETRSGSLLVFEADNTAIVHDMDAAELFPYKLPQMQKIFDAFATMLEQPRAIWPGACRMNVVLREGPLLSEPSETLDPQNWDELRALGHRMLDDMLDYAADIRDRPVWSPIPNDVRARFRAELPRQPSGLDEVYREFTDFIVPYATGNVHPGLHGMGAWRRHRGRHAGGDAGGRTECQSRRPRSYSDRGRTPGRRMDARDVRFAGPGERSFRHRHVDGQSDGGAGGANGGTRTIRSTVRHRRRRVRR